MVDFHISIEAFGLLAGNFDDVLDIVMAPVESSLTNDKDIRRKLQIDKDIFVLESKKSRMTDMLIDGTISREAYDEKQNEFLRKLHTLHDKRKIPDDSINRQKDVGRQMAELRKTLENEEILDEFDRAIFESIIDKVIVGGYDENAEFKGKQGVIRWRKSWRRLLMRKNELLIILWTKKCAH